MALPTSRILIVDDESEIHFALSQVLSRHGYDCLFALSGTEALRAIRREAVDLVLLDLVMPELDGMETLSALKRVEPEIPVIMVTGRGDVAAAVRAVKLGAYDFIEKPPRVERLTQAIQRALERSQLERSVRQLERSLKWILGKSAAVAPVVGQIRQAAASDKPLLVQGEAGTGKSVVARLIHNLGSRAEQPFFALELTHRVHLPDEFYEGNQNDVLSPQGTGTVFVDGFDRMSLPAQARVAEDLRRPGEHGHNPSMDHHVGARLILAAGPNVQKLAREKKVSEELLYLLSSPPIVLPPLRERPDDIPFLARKFLWKASLEFNRERSELTDDSLDLLMHYAWPGNIRELESAIRRSLLVSDDGVLRPELIRSVMEEGAADSPPIVADPVKTVRTPEKARNAVQAGPAEEPPGDDDRYARVLSLSPVGIIVHAGGKLVFVNAAFAEAVGETGPDCLYGRDFFGFVHPDHRERIAESAIAPARRGERTSPVDLKLLKRDGSTVEVEATIFPFEFRGSDSVMVVIQDMTGRKRAEESARARQEELEEKTGLLEEANSALRVLLSHRDRDKEDLENSILENVRKLILPYVEKLRTGRLTDGQVAYLDILESNLNHIVSPFLQKMAAVYSGFTPTEVRIAALIKEGKTTKEIAAVLNVGVSTVHTHRNSIRSKLGVSNKDINLCSYLLSLEEG
jgi:PAS domain S-box-containing protein